MSVSRERSILTGRALAFFLALSLLVAGCKSSRESAMPPSSRPLSAVLAEHAPRLMTMEGVVAVAEGENAAGRPCLKIWATGADRVRARLPKAIDGYDVVVEESGPIEAMDSTQGAGR